MRVGHWFATTIIRLRWAVIAACLALVASIASGLLKLEFTNSYRVFFSPDNPELLAFGAMENTYSKHDNVMFVVVPPDGDVFSRDSLALIETLTTRAWQLPYANRVDSITNFQYTTAIDDDLTVRDLVTDAARLDAGALANVRAAALAEPLLAGNMA
jgi:uncharacterized protein